MKYVCEEEERHLQLHLICEKYLGGKLSFKLEASTPTS